jgi:hypothetical protein
MVILMHPISVMEMEMGVLPHHIPDATVVVFCGANITCICFQPLAGIS